MPAAFEVVSTTIDRISKTLIEEAPLPGNALQFMYREDGRGNGSSNTGYFAHFRQGVLNNSTFAVDNVVANQRITI